MGKIGRSVGGRVVFGEETGAIIGCENEDSLDGEQGHIRRHDGSKGLYSPSCKRLVWVYWCRPRAMFDFDTHSSPNNSAALTFKLAAGL